MVFAVATQDLKNLTAVAVGAAVFCSGYELPGAVIIASAVVADTIYAVALAQMSSGDDDDPDDDPDFPDEDPIPVTTSTTTTTPALKPAATAPSGYVHAGDRSGTGPAAEHGDGWKRPHRNGGRGQ